LAPFTSTNQPSTDFVFSSSFWVVWSDDWPFDFSREGRIGLRTCAQEITSRGHANLFLWIRFAFWYDFAFCDWGCFRFGSFGPFRFFSRFAGSRQGLEVEMTRLANVLSRSDHRQNRYFVVRAWAQILEVHA